MGFRSEFAENALKSWFLKPPKSYNTRLPKCNAS